MQSFAHGAEREMDTRRSGPEPSTANDGRVPIRVLYAEEPVGDESPLSAWHRERLRLGPPFRPKAMVYTGIGTPEDTARRLKLLFDVGAESLLLAWDLPAQLGLDPDHELAYAQVGRAGVSCATLDDWRTIASGVDLRRIDSIGTLANSVGHIGTSMVRTVLEERQAAQTKLVMQNDPLKEFTARGTEICTPEQALRIACDCVAQAVDMDWPGYAITVCSNHYDVAGAGPLTATGLALANAVAYVDELVERGYDVRAVLSKMMFFLNERSDIFVQASLFRTARVLWSDLVAKRYGVPVRDQPVVAMMGYAHGLESPDEPLVNVPRVTLSVTGSMLGGVDYLCAAGYDEALRTPSADAAAMAVRTLQVVGMEQGVTSSLDPLSGSAKIQAIDEHVYTTVDAVVADILERGGGVECIHSGYVAGLIDQGRGTREGQLDRGERTWVGVNAVRADAHRGLFKGQSQRELDFEQTEHEVRARLQAHRRARHTTSLRRALVAVEGAAAGTVNLLPPTREALLEGATVQELMEATMSGFTRGSSS